MKCGGIKNVSFGESKQERKTVRQTLYTLLLKTTKKGKKKSVILNSKNARNHSITLKVVCPWAFCIYKFLNIPATCGEF